MTPPTDKLEVETRLEIDSKLEAAGWVIQDKKAMNLFAGEQGVNGIAVREVSATIVNSDMLDRWLNSFGDAIKGVKKQPL